MNRFGRRSPIFWSVLGFLGALLVLSIILSLLSQAWCADFWPEFLAGLAVAATAFLVVDLLFGITKRKEREDRAKELARTFLDLEIVQNRNRIVRCLPSWRKGDLANIDLEQVGWINLMKPTVFPMLSQDVVGRLSTAYIDLLELRNRLSLWQKGKALQADTIRWAEKTMKSLDTAIEALHEHKHK